MPRSAAGHPPKRTRPDNAKPSGIAFGASVNERLCAGTKHKQGQTHLRKTLYWRCIQSARSVPILDDMDNIIQFFRLTKISYPPTSWVSKVSGVFCFSRFRFFAIFAFSVFQFSRFLFLSDLQCFRFLGLFGFSAFFEYFRVFQFFRFSDFRVYERRHIGEKKHKQAQTHLRKTLYWRCIQSARSVPILDDMDNIIQFFRLTKISYPPTSWVSKFFAFSVFQIFSFWFFAFSSFWFFSFRVFCFSDFQFFRFSVFGFSRFRVFGFSVFAFSVFRFSVFQIFSFWFFAFSSFLVFQFSRFPNLLPSLI